ESRALAADLQQYASSTRYPYNSVSLQALCYQIQYTVGTRVANEFHTLISLVSLGVLGASYPGASKAFFTPYSARWSFSHSRYSLPRRLWSGEQSTLHLRRVYPAVAAL